MTAKKKQEIEFDKKVARPGDAISYYYYGIPAHGVVRKVLKNSVIVSVEGVDPKEFNRLVYNETVIAHKHYAMLYDCKKKEFVSA